ncbi:DNA-binding transcriptional LysR family regulator (plasmid) [Ensifer sp. WSM1721]|uniref:LysR substrate-binding domain-containing protein n=1 Tax=Ensifer sp. WSM1721 TaxID=1041159 RepID=UPI00068874D7|nr:LysR substrate-binding domain-containing protein [Ensifer sp. WSM1721]
MSLFERTRSGVRLTKPVPQDMIAVPFGGPTKFVVVASQDYLASVRIPEAPQDLLHHRCIRHRLPTGKLYRWEFEKHGEQLIIDVPGPLTLDNIPMMIAAVGQWIGFAYVPLVSVADASALGSLRTVLDDWCPAD